MTKTPIIRKPEMLSKSYLEQQIAVFGTARSGKTTLLSTFYGATQEPHYVLEKPYAVIAENQGEAAQLNHNYTSLRNNGTYPPVTTGLNATAHSFTVRLREPQEQPQQFGGALFGRRKRRVTANPASEKPFDAMRLVWHDYPGEWLEEPAADAAEARHRGEVFRSMLGSQVAVLLVDGAKLAQQPGNEGAYLRQLLQTYTNGLLQVRDEVLPDGKPLLQFPRIWIFALSKADLLPQLDVHQFRQLLLSNASSELTDLRETIESFIQAREALSVGEDFLLLSASQQQRGVEILLPLAAMLPFERHAKWAKRLNLPGALSSVLIQGASMAALALMSGKIKVLPSPLRWGLSLVGSAGLERGIKHLGNKLKDHSALSKQREKQLSQALNGFHADLAAAEKARVFLRGKA